MGIKLAKDFKEFLKLLKEKNVEYLLIGGYAVGYYGYPRATQDIDIWIAVNPENANKITEALKEFGFPEETVSEELFLQNGNIIRMGSPPMRIEIITTISGVSFNDCYTSKVVDLVDGIEINIINLNHLKINKKASGRHKDLDDLENLD